MCEVTDGRSRAAAVDRLLMNGNAQVMAQQSARGQYGQVQALFDRGRLVAVHTSVQAGVGIGPSAAARLSVDHPEPRRDIQILGEALGWHGGLTLDYLHEDGSPQYIECNPRTVEPANATASGVNIPDLQVRLTLGERLPTPLRIGRPGVRTHGTSALRLGAAAYRRSRRAVIAELARAITHSGHYRGGREQLTPVLRDPPSAAALAFIVARVLASPTHATNVATKAITSYSITPDAIAAAQHG